MNGLIDYLSRPAPTRITEWPGNPKAETFEQERDTLDNITGSHMMKPIEIDYDGRRIKFVSRGACADFLGIKRSSFNSALQYLRMPHIEKLEAIYFDDMLINERTNSGGKRPIYIVDNGIRYEYDSIQDAAKNYDINHKSLAKWIKWGKCLKRGITEVGRI